MVGDLIFWGGLVVFSVVAVVRDHAVSAAIRRQAQAMVFGGEVRTCERCFPRTPPRKPAGLQLLLYAVDHPEVLLHSPEPARKPLALPQFPHATASPGGLSPAPRRAYQSVLPDASAGAPAVDHDPRRVQVHLVLRGRAVR